MAPIRSTIRPVYVTRHAYRKLIDISTNEWPREACGIVTGTADTQADVVSAVHQMRNTADDPVRHFRFDASEWVNAVYAHRHAIVGIFHSHPHSPPSPSVDDLKQIYFTNYAYWIVSLLNAARPEVRAWRYNNDGKRPSFQPLTFTIMENSDV